MRPGMKDRSLLYSILKCASRYLTSAYSQRPKRQGIWSIGHCRTPAEFNCLRMAASLRRIRMFVATLHP